MSNLVPFPKKKEVKHGAIRIGPIILIFYKDPGWVRKFAWKFLFGANYTVIEKIPKEDIDSWELN